MAHWKVTQRAQHGVEHHRGEIEAYLDRRRNDSLVVFRRRARRNKYNSLSFMRNLSGSLNRGLLFPLYELRGETTRDREMIRRGEREREKQGKGEKKKKGKENRKIRGGGNAAIVRPWSSDLPRPRMAKFRWWADAISHAKEEGSPRGGYCYTLVRNVGQTERERGNQQR